MTVRLESGYGLPPELKAALERVLADPVTKTEVEADAAALDTVSSTTATMTASVRSATTRITAPIAAEVISIVVDGSIAVGTPSLASQPDVPRKLQMVITDTNSSITAGTVAFLGIGVNGQAVSQTINIASGGTHTYTTTDAYATITSITVAGLVGNAAGDHISVGVASALALPGCETPASSTFAVYKASVDNVNETVGTVDATAGTIVPTTLPNGTHNYNFWYNYTVTDTQSSHTHTLS